MKNILLCPLGASPLIAVEAFLMAKNTIEEIHIFSNIQENYAEIIAYFESVNINCTITLLNDFKEIKTENDHFYYEEALFRWYLQFVNSETQISVCLAAGYKAISNSLQKAAGLFGANEVFHLLLNSNFPKSTLDVLALIDSKAINYVSLGAESGWMPIVFLLKDKFSNLTNRADGDITIVEKPIDLKIKTAIDSILDSTKSERTQNYNYELPFNSILMLPILTQNWLKEKLTSRDADWVLSLPKTELHCHLGGFATHGDLLLEVQKADKSKTLNDFDPAKAHPATWNEAIITLDKYMKLGDANGSTLLKNDDCLKKQIELLYKHLCEQNIKYAEIRCSPDNYHTDDRTSFEVLANIKKYFQDEMDAKKASQNFAT